MIKWAIVDANVLLHFQRLDDSRWSKHGPCTFVIPATVIAELDNQKQSSNTRLQRRARALLPWLEQNDGRELSNGCRVALRPTEPHRALGEQLSLDRNHPDDRVIATALEVRAEHSNEEVALLSDDTGPRMKARHHGILAYSPEEDLRLPPSKTKEEQERDEARKRLHDLESRSAILSLSLAEHDGIFKVGPVDESNVEQSLREALVRQKEELGAACTDRYLEEYAKYHRESDTVFRKISRCLRVPLAVRNDGTHHADDVLVEIQWDSPPTFLGELPEFPRAPEKPSGPFGIGIPRFEPPYVHLPTHFARSEPSGPHGEDGNSTVRYRVPRLVHRTTVTLQPLLVVFDSLDSARGFSLNWSIHAAHQVDAARGTINLRVTKDRNIDQVWKFLGWSIGDDDSAD